MIKKKNILFITFDLISGGTEKVLKVILDNLDYSKYSIDLLVFISNGYYFGKINENVNVIPLFDTYEDWVQSLSNNILDRIIHKKVTKNYDTQISFSEGFTSIVASYYGNPKSKKIAWIHCDAEMSDNALARYKNDYLNMDKIVCVSQSSLKSFIKVMGDEFQDKCILINNPMETSQILEQSKEPTNYEKTKPMVLAIGRLCSEKGFDRLIYTHKKLLTEGIDHDLFIWGEGPDYTILRNLISQLNVSNSAKLMGFNPNPYPWISQCDILVSSSQYEACPLVITEAMILQKPIIATITVGSKDLLKYKYGLLVENNEDGLYMGLQALLTSPLLREYYVNSLRELPLLDTSESIRKIELLLDR